MCDFVKQILLNNVEYEKDEKDDKTLPNINEIIELISQNITKKYTDKTIIEEFLDDYLKIDNDIFVSEDELFRGIQNNIINTQMIKNYLENKPTDEEIKNIKIKIITHDLKTNTKSLFGNNLIKYTDETINNFIKYFKLEFKF